MRLPTRQIPDLDELEALRIKKGDIIQYEDETFIADEIGMRYIVAHSPDAPHMRHWFKHQEVVKWFPPTPEEMPDREWRTPLLKRESSR